MFHPPKKSQAPPTQANRKQHLLPKVFVLLQEQLCSSVVHARPAFIRPEIQQNRTSMRIVNSRTSALFRAQTCELCQAFSPPSPSEDSLTPLLEQTQLTRCLSVLIPTDSPFLVLPRSLLWFCGIRVCNPVIIKNYLKIRVLRSTEQHNTPTGDPATFKIVSCSLIQKSKTNLGI